MLLNNYTVDSYEESLKQLNFPNYETCDDAYSTHCTLPQKIMAAIDKIAPIEINEQRGILKNGLIAKF